MQRITALILAILFYAGQSFAAPAAPNSIPNWPKYTSDPIGRTDYVATVNRSVTTESDAGTSAAATVVQVEQAIMPEIGKAEWYEGTTAAKINAALAAKQHVVLGPGNYVVTSQLTMQAGGWLQGSGRGVTTITKNFNGDLFASFPAGAGITDLLIDGEGATYTGRILPVLGTDGLQYMRDFTITDCNGYCIEFEIDAGSQSTFSSGLIARYNGTAAGRYSVKIPPEQQLSAVPRKFRDIETNGTLFADLGGGGGAEFNGGFWGGFLFGAETRSVRISGGRIGNVLNMDIDGHNNTITGCNISPNLNLISGTDANTVQANTYNGVITDNSGNGRNLIDYNSQAYTPIWTAVTTNPAIGNGAIIGEHSRSGDKLSVAIELLIGSTTTPGVGAWRFSLPKAPTTYSQATQMFPVWLTDAGTTTQIGVAFVIDATAYVTLGLPGGNDLVDATHPWTWAAGDSIRISFTYIL